MKHLQSNDMQRLTDMQIARLSSPYLDEGRRQERWHIDCLELDRTGLVAKVSMQSTYVSSTDPGGFHLSIFPAFEFASQLAILYMHWWIGLQDKTREVWMSESRTRSKKAIRRADVIDVRMQANKMRQRGDLLYSDVGFEVSDDQGGLTEISLKGLML